MQAQTIPLSLNGAGAAAAAGRGPAADVAADAAIPFAEALSREIGQRQQAGEADITEAALLPAALTAADVETADAAEAAVLSTDAASILGVTDMLALAATLTPPKMGTDPISGISTATKTGTKMGSDPISGISAETREMGSDPISGISKGMAEMGSDPISGISGASGGAAVAAPVDSGEGRAPASPASALFAQALTQVAQAPATGSAMKAAPEAAAQLRTMFASATVLPSQAPSAAPEPLPAAGLPVGATVQPAAPGRSAAQAAPAAQATPSPAADAQQDMVALAAGAETVAEPAAAEAPPQNTFATQLQAVRPEQAQAMPMAGAERLPARVGTPAWDRQLGQKIVFMAAGADQSASLTLNPPDLGPVQVVLNISNDQASVAFSSAQLEVRQALENAMPKLREMMGESGITLGNATVNAGLPEPQQQAQRGQDPRAGSHNGNGNGNGNGRGNGAGAGADDAAPPALVRRAVPGAVDTFA